MYNMIRYEGANFNIYIISYRFILFYIILLLLSFHIIF